jgi:hypothetical protein
MELAVTIVTPISFRLIASVNKVLLAKFRSESDSSASTDGLVQVRETLCCYMCLKILSRDRMNIQGILN